MDIFYLIVMLSFVVFAFEFGTVNAKESPNAGVPYLNMDDWTVAGDSRWGGVPVTDMDMSPHRLKTSKEGVALTRNTANSQGSVWLRYPKFARKSWAAELSLDVTTNIHRPFVQDNVSGDGIAFWFTKEIPQSPGPRGAFGTNNDSWSGLGVFFNIRNKDKEESYVSAVIKSSTHHKNTSQMEKRCNAKQLLWQYSATNTSDETSSFRKSRDIVSRVRIIYDATLKTVVVNLSFDNNDETNTEWRPCLTLRDVELPQKEGLCTFFHHSFFFFHI